MRVVLDGDRAGRAKRFGVRGVGVNQYVRGLIGLGPSEQIGCELNAVFRLLAPGRVDPNPHIRCTRRFAPRLGQCCGVGVSGVSLASIAASRYADRKITVAAGIVIATLRHWVGIAAEQARHRAPQKVGTYAPTLDEWIISTEAARDLRGKGGPPLVNIPRLTAYHDVDHVLRSKDFVQAGGGHRENAPMTLHTVVSLSDQDHFERRRLEAPVFSRQSLSDCEQEVLGPTIATVLANYRVPATQPRSEPHWPGIS